MGHSESFAAGRESGIHSCVAALAAHRDASTKAERAHFPIVALVCNDLIEQLSAIADAPVRLLEQYKA